MSKLEKACIRLDKNMVELNEYLEIFGHMPPKGEGAKEQAVKEFRVLIKKIHESLNILETAQIEELGEELRVSEMTTQEIIEGNEDK